MTRIILFGLIIVALASCTRINVDQELAQLDSLGTVIRNAETIMDDVNLDQVKTLHEQMSNQIMLAKSLYGDSIEWEKAKLLTQYYGVKKAFGKYIDKQAYFTSELNFSRKQLEDLSTDLQGNIISTDSFNIYFDMECQVIVELKELILGEVTKTKTNIESYENYSSKVIEMLEDQS